MAGNTEELEDTKLYQVIADLYTGQMLGAVEEQSYGILSIVPRDAEGREISPQELENHIIHVDGQELKALWPSIWNLFQRQKENLRYQPITKQLIIGKLLTMTTVRWLCLSIRIRLPGRFLVSYQFY